MTEKRTERLTIDLAGLRDRIEGFRDDPAWQALSLSKKIRILIERGLVQDEEQPSTSK